MVRADNHRLPKVVIESGWSESWQRLTDDMSVSLVGGNGDVKVAIHLDQVGKNREFRPCERVR